MNPLIRIENLRYSYADGTVALDGIDFLLREGETVALLGANGSGKTTFVHHLNGLLIGKGEVTVAGLPVNRGNLTSIRRLIGIVFQDADDQLFMPTVLEDVAFGPLNQGVAMEEAQELARRMLSTVGMAEAAGRAPYHLSAGEKRRVAIAGVLAMQPKVLVLDEPTTYLDPPAQRELITVVRQLPQAKIIVTHDTKFAEAIATRAVFFKKGRIIDEGTVEEVSRRRGW